MPILRIFRESHRALWRDPRTKKHRKYFPPVSEGEKTEPKATSTDETELAAKLPNAPAEDPKDPVDVEEPSAKKQKTEASDDDFVVVDKPDTKADL